MPKEVKDYLRLLDKPLDESEAPEARNSALGEDALWHVLYSLGQDNTHLTERKCYWGLVLAVRDRMLEKWSEVQRRYYKNDDKRLYYLSLEFLPGKFLRGNLLALGLENEAHEFLRERGFSLDEIIAKECEPGLGNGGLGRLASCYMDSMATYGLPAYGYGIRYSYGLFRQEIRNGQQVEQPDNWLHEGTHWLIPRPYKLYPVRFYGTVYEWLDDNGILRHDWRGGDLVMAMANDVLVPGYRNGHVNSVRLWEARPHKEFVLSSFNAGDYIGSVQEKISDENISMVLYPSDDAPEGKTLRLKQQYFFVAATMHDMVRRFKKLNKPWDQLPEKNVVQLNETHPSIAIPELMRILLDEELLSWEEAWYICQKLFAYTNHTVLPEALETWTVELMEKLLPRHMQIIYEINRRFLEDVRLHFRDEPDLPSRVSLITAGPEPRVRMSHLAIVGSFSVNGVSALHTQILRDRVFHDFIRIFPDRFNNKTNGVTPRRWLRQCNVPLSWLLSEHLGCGWVTDLNQLEKLRELVDVEEFRHDWEQCRLTNKKRLADYIEKMNGITVNPHSIFDVQVKRFHEYKRQLLNILHIISLYNNIRKKPEVKMQPCTFIFGGKAAPSYRMAKDIIYLINCVARRVNSDPHTRNFLKVIFLANYNVSLAQLLVPATDVSEQISTAGYEASGTGNMKFALNGALTLGTRDGSNIEIAERVGDGNIYLFGLCEQEVIDLRRRGYDPWDIYKNDSELREVLDMINSDQFTPGDPTAFSSIFNSLLSGGDPFMILADYRAYVEAHKRIAHEYVDRELWIKKSIMNTAGMGFFSSDRAIKEYSEGIWDIAPDV
ncbi:glycogen/starch/alpha-glucan phosphorylase [Halodesulfovibrio aestuarii]|uniref:Alpha-1,4 glucan phosphorylase n=1 Tax=Halodesulfovibrio aestuarii TaxID=126333 RepID=A0A8G2F7M5_9BACT|nr:glycogen/starch/alpha-glucan phosphorylase [Halodesulfovibrio aestuarii]SHJ03836.1 glycogen phosphorylase [Halodesulfovibrio aestuarii]